MKLKFNQAISLLMQNDKNASWDEISTKKELISDLQ
jgi:hypothetical protein